MALGLRLGQVCTGEGRVLKASTVLRGGEVLWIAIPGIAATTEAPSFPTILHEDARMVVVDKPSGLLVHPAGTNFAWALIGLARERWPGRAVHVVHRLDRDTSGVVALALDEDAARFLKTALHDGDATKAYDAVVRGVPTWDERSCTGAIGHEGRSVRIRMAVTLDGQASRTDVRVVERREDRTRVRCQLWTGRTHQIRVHLAHEGVPVLGDRLYGVSEALACAWLEQRQDVRVEAGAPRLALHAAFLELPHPDGGRVAVSAPWPDDLQQVLDGTASYGLPGEEDGAEGDEDSG